MVPNVRFGGGLTAVPGTRLVTVQATDECLGWGNW